MRRGGGERDLPLFTLLRRRGGRGPWRIRSTAGHTESKRMSETYNLFQQGKARLRDGMAAQATVPLEKAKRREPEKASIREALGIAYFRLQRYDEAADEFRKMLELSPADDYAH